MIKTRKVSCLYIIRIRNKERKQQRKELTAEKVIILIIQISELSEE